MRLAALAFFSTAPLASFLGSLPLLSQEGIFLLADTPSTGLLRQALQPGWKNVAATRLYNSFAQFFINSPNFRLNNCGFCGNLHEKPESMVSMDRRTFL